MNKFLAHKLCLTGNDGDDALSEMKVDKTSTTQFGDPRLLAFAQTVHGLVKGSVWRVKVASLPGEAVVMLWLPLMVVISVRAWVINSAHINYYVTLIKIFLFSGANYSREEIMGNNVQVEEMTLYKPRRCTLGTLIFRKNQLCIPVFRKYPEHVASEGIIAMEVSVVGSYCLVRARSFL